MDENWKAIALPGFMAFKTFHGFPDLVLIVDVAGNVRPGSQRPGDGHDDNGRPRGTGTVSEDDISQKTYITLIGKDHKVIDEIIAKGKAIYDLKKIEKTHTAYF
jgi:hypothetical protein